MSGVSKESLARVVLSSLSVAVVGTDFAGMVKLERFLLGTLPADAVVIACTLDVLIPFDELNSLTLTSWFEVYDSVLDEYQRITLPVNVDNVDAVAGVYQPRFDFDEQNGMLMAGRDVLVLFDSQSVPLDTWTVGSLVATVYYSQPGAV